MKNNVTAHQATALVRSAAFCAVALGVSATPLSADTLTRNGIEILRREEGFLLPRPDQTGDVPVAFTESLLPGDPRGG